MLSEITKIIIFFVILNNMKPDFLTFSSFNIILNIWTYLYIVLYRSQIEKKVIGFV